MYATRIMTLNRFYGKHITQSTTTNPHIHAVHDRTIEDRLSIMGIGEAAEQLLNGNSFVCLMLFSTGDVSFVPKAP